MLISLGQSFVVGVPLVIPSPFRLFLLGGLFSLICMSDLLVFLLILLFFFSFFIPVGHLLLSLFFLN